ncbi:MAG TPA: CoA transferase, partial [Vicinamibacterales bacterium]|nr:CoA transferase [Vicinamibacterales bacterium]
GLEAPARDPRFATNAGRVVEYESLRLVLAAALAARPVSALITALREAGVPCGAVRSVGEALADPQIVARDMIATIEHPALGPLKLLGLPVKLSNTPGTVRRHPPQLGEHTRDVLQGDLGVTGERLAELESIGVVRLRTGR